MSTRTILVNGWPALAAAACRGLTAASCGGEMLRTGRSPMFLVVDGMERSPGGNGGTHRHSCCPMSRRLVESDGQRGARRGADDLQRHRDGDDPRRGKEPEGDATHAAQRHHADALSRELPPYGRPERTRCRRAVRLRWRPRHDHQPGQRQRRSPSKSSDTRPSSSRPSRTLLAAAGSGSSRRSPRSLSTATTRTATKSRSRVESTCSSAISPTNKNANGFSGANHHANHDLRLTARRRGTCGPRRMHRQGR